MIEKLLDILSHVEIDLEAEDIADVLWLASHLDQVTPDIGITAQVDMGTQHQPLDASSKPREARQQKREKPELSLTTEATSSQVFLPSHQGGIATGGIAFRSPTASALPGALGIARALRPFKRRISSNSQFYLDEDATAERIAELGIWLPILKPAMIPWFEIALVIDEGASMVVWQQTVTELRFLLEHHGAFRDVRTWRLITDTDNGKAQIGVSTGFNTHTQQIRSPGELLVPNGHRLVLVVTDCVSPGWHNGEVIRILATWAEKTSVVIAQVLPQRLWSRTSLGIAKPVHLRMSSSVNSNTRLSTKITNNWIESGTLAELPMPVITLEAKAFSAWSRMLTGTTDVALPGFLLAKNISSVKEEHKYPVRISQDERSSGVYSPDDRLQLFQTTASPLSRKLVQLLAASPISFPIIRLIQHTMVPEASQVHIAEFFLSGLLEELPSQEAIAHPDDVQYEFIDGVRDKLLESLSLSDSLQVLKAVSDFISDKFGQSLDFNALFAHPQGVAQIYLHEKTKPFAMIATKVLRRFGGNYAKLAEEIEHATNSQHLDVQQIDMPSQKPFTREDQKESVHRSPVFNNPLGFVETFYREKRRRCPSCINLIYAGDCEIVAAIDAEVPLDIVPPGIPKRSFASRNTVLIQKNTVLKKAPPRGSIQQTSARISTEQLTGEFYMLTMAHRVCPICGYALPPNFDNTKSLTVAVVGDTASGKSSYNAALIKQLQSGRLMRADQAMSFTCLTPDVEDYYQNYFNLLFKDKRALPPTQRLTEMTHTPLIYELALRSTKERPVKILNLIFYDSAGEDQMISERLLQYARYILTADAIIFLADPIAMPEIARHLPLSVNYSVAPNRSPAEGLNKITSLIERFKGKGGLRSVPIAITVSKSDLLKYLMPISGQYHFMLLHEYRGGINLRDLEVTNKEVRDFIEIFGDRELLALAESFKKVHFFATSATGYSPDQNGIFPSTEPQRCLDPFFWILHELKVIFNDRSF